MMFITSCSARARRIAPVNCLCRAARVPSLLDSWKSCPTSCAALAAYSSAGSAASSTCDISLSRSSTLLCTQPCRRLWRSRRSPGPCAAVQRAQKRQSGPRLRLWSRRRRHHIRRVHDHPEPTPPPPAARVCWFEPKHRRIRVSQQGYYMSPSLGGSMAKHVNLAAGNPVPAPSRRCFRLSDA